MAITFTDKTFSFTVLYILNTVFHIHIRNTVLFSSED